MHQLKKGTNPFCSRSGPMNVVRSMSQLGLLNNSLCSANQHHWVSLESLKTDKTRYDIRLGVYDVVRFDFFSCFFFFLSIDFA